MIAEEYRRRDYAFHLLLLYECDVYPKFLSRSPNARDPNVRETCPEEVRSTEIVAKSHDILAGKTRCLRNVCIGGPCSITSVLQTLTTHVKNYRDAILSQESMAMESREVTTFEFSLTKI